MERGELVFQYQMFVSAWANMNGKNVEESYNLAALPFFEKNINILTVPYEKSMKPSTQKIIEQVRNKKALQRPRFEALTKFLGSIPVMKRFIRNRVT